MTCREARRLMYLIRPEEVSPKEQKEVHEHLVVCENCNAEHSRVVTAAAYIDRLREVSPLIESPDSLTDNIMTAISRREETSASSRNHIIEIVLEFLFRPGVRIGYATILICLLSLAFAQGLALLISVHQLEQGITQSGQQDTPLRVAYPVQARALHGLPIAMLGQFMPELLQDKDDVVMVSKETASRLAASLRAYAQFPFVLRNAGIDQDAITLFLQGTGHTSLATITLASKER